MDEESAVWEVIESAMAPLDPEARRRVLRYAWSRFVGEDIPAEIAEPIAT